MSVFDWELRPPLLWGIYKHFAVLQPRYMFDNGGSRTAASKSIHLCGWQKFLHFF